MTNLENRNPFDQPDRRKGGTEFIKSNWYIFKTSILLSLKLTTDNILGRRMHFTAYWATAQKTSTDCLGPHFLCAFRWDYVYYLIRRFSLRLKKKPNEICRAALLGTPHLFLLQATTTSFHNMLPPAEVSRFPLRFNRVKVFKKK